MQYNENIASNLYHSKSPKTGHFRKSDSNNSLFLESIEPAEGFWGQFPCPLFPLEYYPTQITVNKIGLVINTYFNKDAVRIF